MGVDYTKGLITLLLECGVPYFPWVLLYARLQVQFKDGNNTREGSINITKLLCLYVHCAPSSFSLSKINRALLHNQAIIQSQ